jgi:hypothetical protein
MAAFSMAWSSVSPLPPYGIFCTVNQPVVLKGKGDCNLSILSIPVQNEVPEQAKTNFSDRCHTSPYKVQEWKALAGRE